MVFRKDVADRGVTYYKTGGKKLINVFCGERPKVMCCARADDGWIFSVSIHAQLRTYLSSSAADHGFSNCGTPTSVQSYTGLVRKIKE
jgi:hypothetical protein